MRPASWRGRAAITTARRWKSGTTWRLARPNALWSTRRTPASRSTTSSRRSVASSAPSSATMPGRNASQADTGHARAATSAPSTSSTSPADRVVRDSASTTRPEVRSRTLSEPIQSNISLQYDPEPPRLQVVKVEGRRLTGVAQGLADARPPGAEGVLEVAICHQEAGAPAAELAAERAQLAVDRHRVLAVEPRPVGRIAQD